MVAIILCDIAINKYTKQTTFCNFAIYSSSNLYIWRTRSKTDCICPISVHSYKHKYIHRETDAPIYIMMDKICLYSSPTDLKNTRRVLILNTQTEWLDSRFTVNLRLLRHLNLQLWYCGDFSFEFNTQCVLWKECVHEEALACLHHLGGWGTNWWNSRYTTQPELCGRTFDNLSNA